MMKKQSLWFLTLFSLILVMGVYYITMPNDIFVSKQEEVNKDINKTVQVIENEYLTALKQEYEETIKIKKQEFEEILNSSKSTADEKNNAYLGIKDITSNKEQEQLLESGIKKDFQLDSFVKISGSDIEVVVIKEKHDATIANDIMRFIQKQYDTNKNISVTFKK